MLELLYGADFPSAAAAATVGDFTNKGGIVIDTNSVLTTGGGCRQLGQGPAQVHAGGQLRSQTQT